MILDSSQPMLANISKLVSLIGILIISFLVDNLLIRAHFNEKPLYDEAEIRFQPTQDFNIAKYAVRDEGNFLFAASSPEELDIQLFFKRSANLTVSVEPIYQTSCPEAGRNQAEISFFGDLASETILLHNPLPKTRDFSVHKDSLLKVKVSNFDYPDCGKALVTFIEHNNSQYASIAFVLVWLLIFIACLTSKTSTLVALTGAAFGALLIWAETTLGSLNLFSISITIALSVTLSGGLFIYSSIPLVPIASILLALLAALCVVVAFFIPIAIIGHEFIFDKPINDESIHAVLQSYLAQAIEFWGQFVGVTNSIYAVIGIIITILICLRLNHYKKQKLVKASIGLLLIMLSAVFVFDRWTDTRILDLLDKSIKVYRSEILSFQRISTQRKLTPIESQQDPDFKDNTTVFVIGESVNRNHMSAYGYVRTTTPFIDQRIADDNLIKFSNVFSNHTHSNPTLSFLLTQANQYNALKWSEAPSILNIASAVSLKSTWYTNHRLLGGWSNYITSIAQDADVIQTINNKIGYGNSAFQYDEKLLPLWREAIKENPNQVSFLHFYNSHFDYCNRYPESAIKFNEKVSRVVFGEWVNDRKIKSDMLNCYDNSIAYTDQLLEEVILELDNNDKPALLVYTSDHADDVIEARFHNSAQFTHSMTTIPLFVWANDVWRAQHPNVWENIKQNKDTAFTNDLMFESIVGLLGISSDSIDQSFDFSSANFSPPEDLKTLHATRLVKQDINWGYWQMINTQQLINDGFKLGAANIDSVANAVLAINMGFESLHINTYYSEDEKFQLTDNRAMPIGLDLKTFLQTIDSSKLSSVKITINNQTQYNESVAKATLDSIAESFIPIIVLDEVTSSIDIFASDLLDMPEINQHDKSQLIMLNLISQFDQFKLDETTEE